MNWNEPFVIYRISPEGKIEQVYVAKDLKAAKYWLTYIALPGDVLCKTPVHPKHSKSSTKPEYWSHKEASGTPATDEGKWQEIAQEKKCDLQFPESQLT